METLHEFTSTLPDLLIKVFFAILCGGIIGLERERRGKPAGLRTNILICLGSMLYMLLSDLVALRLLNSPADPTRIAAQVVTGIGFIGAGTIIQSRGTITGLTTAAVIWTVAAIGLCIGIGFPLVALLFTVMVLFVLSVLSRYESRILGKCHYVNCTIEIKEEGGKTWAELSEILREYDVTTSNYELRRQRGTIYLDIQYCDKHPAHNRFLFDLWKASGVRTLRNDKSSPILK
jgi:putative Mg2+ transporter-C (MgtC) family protein